jgi:PAS domain S-box-containing protein
MNRQTLFEGYLLRQTKDVQEKSYRKTQLRLKRKKPEEALTQSEQRFCSVLNNSLDVIYRLNLQTGRYEYMSPSCKTTLDIEAEELMTMSNEEVLSRVHPEDWASLKSELERINKVGKGVSQYRFMGKDGKYSWWLNQMVVTKDENGKPLFRDGFVRNVTESKKDEEALRVSEEKFSKAFKNGPIAVTLTRLSDGKVVDVNDSAAELLGYTREESIGNTVVELNVWANPSERAKLTEMLRNKGFVTDLEAVFRKKDKTHINGLVSASLIEIENEQFLLSSVVDVTERKQAEEALRESEQLYKTIFDNGDDGFVLVEPIYDENNDACDILFLQLNLAYERQTGTRATKVEGRRAKEVAPNLEQEWISLCGEVAKAGKPLQIESFNQRTNKWYDANYVPFTRGRVGILFRDVTERKNLEKQLQEKERLAAIGSTAGMVGHDIRNPLQAIASDVFLLKSNLAEMPESKMKVEMQESLDGIEANVHYINKIVQDLQDYARPINPSPLEISLETMCEEVLFKNGVPDNVDVSCQIENKVKRIVADPEMLKRILSNLVTNALQAMPNGGKIRIHAYQESGNTVITVQDTGGGIPEDVKPKLFTPLFTTKSKGQGFGLAVVKRMTEALHGTVTFESKVREGTKFIVCLPPQEAQKEGQGTP